MSSSTAAIVSAATNILADNDKLICDQVNAQLQPILSKYCAYSEAIRRFIGCLSQVCYIDKRLLLLHDCLFFSRSNGLNRFSLRRTTRHNARLLSARPFLPCLVRVWNCAAWRFNPSKPSTEKWCHNCFLILLMALINVKRFVSPWCPHMKRWMTWFTHCGNTTTVAQLHSLFVSIQSSSPGWTNNCWVCCLVSSTKRIKTCVSWG